MFEFVSANQADFAVSRMCEVLGVSTSGYYAWRKRTPSSRKISDSGLKERIRQIHQESRGTYGAPRVHIELREEGTRVSRKRVARLMQEAQLQGVHRRKWVRTTQRERYGRPAPDLVDRNFDASEPNRLWVADVTYVPTWTGFVYLAVVMDTFSRRIVGWAMANHLRTSLVLDALEMALSQRKPTSVVHHSDQGSHYTSIEFGARCERAGVRPSMGSVGDCFDNAMCESFFATLECELIDRSSFHSHQDARTAIFDFIEGWYNTRRRHSAIDYCSPVQFERRYHRAA